MRIFLTLEIVVRRKRGENGILAKSAESRAVASANEGGTAGAQENEMSEEVKAA